MYNYVCSLQEKRCSVVIVVVKHDRFGNIKTDLEPTLYIYYNLLVYSVYSQNSIACVYIVS